MFCMLYDSIYLQEKHHDAVVYDLQESRCEEQVDEVREGGEDSVDDESAADLRQTYGRL